MTSDVTDLETSRRLWKVWQDNPSAWWVVVKGQDAFVRGGLPTKDTPYAARPLSELEAEIKRMGLCIRLEFIPLDHEGKDATVAVALYHWNIDSDRLAAETTSNTTINALGNAVAEAKEKR